MMRHRPPVDGSVIHFDLDGLIARAGDTQNIRDCLQVVNRVGLPLATCFHEPPCLGPELHRYSVRFRTAVRGPRIRSRIRAGGAGIVPLPLYENFRVHDGTVPYQPAGERLRESHAVFVIGWRPTERIWILQNSYGDGWGDHGYFTLPFDHGVLELENLCFVITDVHLL